MSQHIAVDHYATGQRETQAGTRTKHAQFERADCVAADALANRELIKSGGVRALSLPGAQFGQHVSAQLASSISAQ
eukprot:5046521-Pyramimonas_sp.AAC.1